MTTINPEGIGNDADDEGQDWCSGCENITYWNPDESCRACGYVWGSGA